MSKTQGPEPSPLDALQPDGNFQDDPSPADDLAAQEAAERLADERAANRQGPSHPAHAFHQQWLDERNLGPEWDNPTGR
jgi:hypothetical protein